MAVLILAVALSGASSALSGIRTHLSVSRVAPPRMALFDRFRRSKSDCGKTAAKLIAEEVAESKGAATLTDVKREAERLRVESEAADFFRREAVRRWRSSVRARPKGSSSAHPFGTTQVQSDAADFFAADLLLRISKGERLEGDGGGA